MDPRPSNHPRPAPRPPPPIARTIGPPAPPAFECSWPLPTALPTLAAGEVHVWCARLDAHATHLAALAVTLSETERQRAERFQFERDRDRYVARHGLLRQILASYLHSDPAQISFRRQERGKPVLDGGPDTQCLHFNLSHSDGLALVAVTHEMPVGIDAEWVRPIPDAGQVAARFFSPRENVVLNTVPEGQMLDAFFRCWTRKEAYLKATGEGIADSLARIEVSLEPGALPEVLSVADDLAEAARWSLHNLEPATGCVGALAIRARNVTPACRRWPGPDEPPLR